MCVHIYESHCVRVHNGTELRVEVGVLSRQELAQLGTVSKGRHKVYLGHIRVADLEDVLSNLCHVLPFRWAQNKKKSEKRGNENQIQIPNVGEVRTDCLTKKRSDRWALTGPGLPGNDNDDDPEPTTNLEPKRAA